MRQDKKRILRITEELVNFLFTAGATDVRTRVQREPERYLLTIESDFSTDKRGDNMARRRNTGNRSATSPVPGRN